ncbi:hypothetical protein RCL1_002809 [Eukaryota sp. TZLM3-RCL]
MSGIIVSPLSVSPSSLVFPSSTERCSIEIELCNSSEEQVCFKLKTTSREGYFVKPASGFIKAKSTSYVQIQLNPHKTTPGKDKFLLQAYILRQEIIDTSEVSETNVLETWNLIESDPAKKSKIFYQRLCCSTCSEVNHSPRVLCSTSLPTQHLSDDISSLGPSSTRNRFDLQDIVEKAPICSEKEDMESTVVITREELDKLRQELASAEVERDSLKQQLTGLCDYVGECSITAG